MGNIYEHNLIDIKDGSIREGFVILPRKVIRAKGLSLQAKMVYGLLLDYAWQKGSCYPGQTRMGKDLGVHRNTIYRLIDELKSYGLISSKQRPNKTNIYYIEPLEAVANLNSYSLDAQSTVNPVSQDIVQQDSPSMVKEVKAVEYKKNKYKQTLYNCNEDLNLDDFDKRAVLIAKDLNDLKSIKYYQKIINEEKRGFINSQDIDEALELARREKRRDEVDGVNKLTSPGALFNKFLRELSEKRRSSSRPKTNYELAREKLLKKLELNDSIVKQKTLAELNHERNRQVEALKREEGLDE